MNLKHILKAAFFTPGLNNRWGLPLLFVGIPGGGKSTQLESESRALGLHAETLISSLRDPTDFGGMPFIGTKDGQTTFQLAAMPWVHRAADAGHAAVLFDEINTAPQSVFASLLRVILEGVVGDYRLPSTVRFVAAMNPVECSAGGNDIPPPLANRFGHIRFENPDAQAWTSWLLGGAAPAGQERLDPKAEEARVMDEWPTAWAKARGTVSGFVRARPNLLHKMPTAFDPGASMAWPSPRTWEMATRALAGSEVHALDQTNTEVLVEAFVGTAAASEFITYLAKLDLPDPADVLDGKVQFKHEPSRLDRTAAVLDSCAALVSSPTAPKRNARADVLWRLLGDIGKSALDVIVPCGVTLVKAQLLTPASKPVLVQLQPVLKAAGITGA